MSRTSVDSRSMMADAHSSSNLVPVLFSFSELSRPSSVPLGSGSEVLIQKFLSIYGHQIDVHRKLVLQCFSEEWGQYVDLPKGFTVTERCRLRLVPLQMHESLEMTSTFKQQKFSLVESGFDPCSISEPLFFLDCTEKSYIPLTSSIYDSIVSGQKKV